MKDYWGDATGMNNRPHLSAENMDTIAAACDAVIVTSETPASPSPDISGRRTISDTSSEGSAKRVKRTQGECVEANLGAVAKGFSEGLVVLGKGLADVQNEDTHRLATAVQKQTELFQIQSDRAHAQTLQLLEQIETQSEQLRQQNQNMRELLNLIRHRN
ncbi:hypothetical protein GN244_ATG00817 [Phytophthora infestans]|uniref:Uncharacterized protein n=1 Tax=Phytophthora infestans TaxID=4787 RepID=A0A833WNF9_PHYIN|nr:hypothetical protein GN244_ATG00817 [Phytophthora infestans]KAF4131930.1 hypothetical protein GN958_ATG18963 [Phytophthora infestans]